MFTKLSVDQALLKAKSYVMKNELTEAQKLYRSILLAFPKNKRAQEGLAALEKLKRYNVKRTPPQDTVKKLINLYNQGQFTVIVEQGQVLTNQYPEAFTIWNILGASASQTGMLDKAINAYKKCILLKPDYADAYSNMSVALKDQGKLDEAIEVCNKAISLKPNYTEAYNNLGNILKDQGKLEKAIEAYHKCISLKPDYAEAYSNMGLALKDQGELDEALKVCKKALLIRPNYASAYNNIGNIFTDQSKLDEAIEAFKKALTFQPNYADAYNNLGNALRNQGKLDEAIDVYKKGTILNPDYADTYNNLGKALQGQDKFDEAIEAYKKCISLKPDYTEVYNNLGKSLREIGKLDQAINAYKKALLLKPDYEMVYNNMGIALQEQGKLDEAMHAYHKALSLKPDYALVYNNMGNLLRDQVKLDEAIDAYNKSISLEPDYVESYSNMGITLKYQGKLDQAIEAYNKSISLKPDYAQAHHNLGLALLNKGRVKEGLDECEWRWQTDEFLSQQRYFVQPLWDGKQSLNGKRILLWSEQGIGDTINWSSCLPYVTSQAEHCIVECQEKLVPLLERSFPNVEIKVVDKTIDLERNDFDVHLPMGSLYKHYLNEIIHNPKPKAFLVPNLVRVNYWKKRLKSLGKGPYIGISWKSSVDTAYRLQHYPPISEWSPVLTVPDVTFINLQYVNFENDLKTVKDEFGVKIHHFDDLDQYNNVDDVAALCAALDVVASTKVTPPFISSGVGTQTIIANWKQSAYNNFLNNPVTSSFEMHDRNLWETWDNVFNSIAENIIKLKDKNNYYEIKL